LADPRSKVRGKKGGEGEKSKRKRREGGPETADEGGA